MYQLESGDGRLEISISAAPISLFVLRSGSVRPLLLRINARRVFGGSQLHRPIYVNTLLQPRSLGIEAINLDYAGRQEFRGNALIAAYLLTYGSRPGDEIVVIRDGMFTQTDPAWR